MYIWWHLGIWQIYSHHLGLPVFVKRDNRLVWHWRFILQKNNCCATSFAVSGAIISNDLHPRLRTITCLDSFKCELRKTLCSHYLVRCSLPLWCYTCICHFFNIRHVRAIWLYCIVFKLYINIFVTLLNVCRATMKTSFNCLGLPWVNTRNTQIACQTLI